MRGVWEKPGMVNLFCEHSELFSETWLIAGSMRNGMVSKPQTQEHLTEDSESLSLLRTPAASEAERGHQPEEKAKARGGQVTLSGQFMNLPTPTAFDFNTVARSELDGDDPRHRLKVAVEVLARDNELNFGKFESAVRRWEEVIGLPAPAPTKPDGKDGAHRLSSEFAEWMMGLRPGWVTGVGLSRKDELKACGNGVVPQQAMLALKMLKARFELE